MRPSNRTLFVAQVGVMVAIAVMVRRVLTPQITGLNLGGLPLILSGLLLGPLGGAYTGVLSDVIGALMAPWPYFPGYTLTALLTGALPPLLLRLMGRRPLDAGAAHLIAAVLATQLITKVGLIPIFDWWLMGWPIGLTAAKNLGVELIHAPLYGLIAHTVLRGVRRGLPRTGGGVAQVA